MNKDRKEESWEQQDIEDEETCYRKTGISTQGLHELEMCPFVDELVRLNHEPTAVIAAEYRAEQARRDGDQAAALEAEYLAELARLNHEWAPLLPSQRLAIPAKTDRSSGGPSGVGDPNRAEIGQRTDSANSA